MSQIDRRLKNVQQADLSEGRVNDDFVLWLKTWGQNLLLVVLVIAALGMAWHWWQQRKERERDDAWAELDGATLPAALEEIAARHAGKDSVALFAELEAADTYLLAVITGKRFDREASAVDAAITPELRAEWLKEADRLYAKVADRVTKAGSTGEYGFLFSALFGRAAVAEDLGDLKSAEAHLRTIEDRSKGTDFAAAGEVAAKRLASLSALATPVKLPSKPVVAPSAPMAIPDLTGSGTPSLLSAPAPGPAPAGSGPASAEDVVKQLQGGSPAPAGKP